MAVPVFLTVCALEKGWLGVKNRGAQGQDKAADKRWDTPP
jgi:hypothetical protein